MSEAIIKTAVGQCVEIDQKPGSEWVTFNVDVGTQYPVRLQTKLQPLIELARAAGAEERAWTYKESESQNLNPNSGKPYMNRYLERVDLPGDAPDSEPDASVTQSAAKAPQTPGSSSEGMTKEEWGRKDAAIHKMACIKTAAAVLTHTLPSDPTPEDMGKFLQRSSTLVASWYASVIAVRDGSDEIPF